VPPNKVPESERDVDYKTAWSVSGDLLTCLGTPVGILYREGVYEDYILELEFRFLNKRSRDSGAPANLEIALHWYPKDSDYFNLKVDHHGQCSITPANKARCTPLRAQGEALTVGKWHRLEVRSKSGVIQLFLDGKYLGKATDCSSCRGHIAFHSAGHQVNYRNVRIRELP
jgi:hypothetical protein